MTSVSNPGRRRGRGKGAGKKIAKDLNRGQIMGHGVKNMIWPGLNAPIIQGNELIERKELGPDKEYQEKLIKMRDQMSKLRKAYVHPMDRGWSSTRLAGRWIGPPNPVGNEEFTGFDTKVIFLKPVFCMKANFGKTKKMSCLLVTGNKNGLAGFAVGKSKDPRTATKKASKKAGQRLVYAPLHDGHTVLHDFHSRFGATNVFVRKKPRGYGLAAHRCIRAICEAFGITDIHCKVEGSEKNYLNVTRAFFLGLVNQKTFQQMADEKRLLVVEQREDRDNYPVIMASPSLPCRTRDQIKSDEILDFSMYVHDGQVKDQKIVKPCYYTKDPAWQSYLKKWHHERSKTRVRVELLAKYGAVESFLNINERKRIEEKRKTILEQRLKETEKEVAEDTQ